MREMVEKALAGGEEMSPELLGACSLVQIPKGPLPPEVIARAKELEKRAKEIADGK
jgi:hypothetical protein